MATRPSVVRAGLAVVTAAAMADVATVAQRAGESPEEIRAALFAATPLIVGEYSDGSSALALDWYDEIRTDAAPRRSYTPTPFTSVTDTAIAGMVAETTVALRDATDESLAGARTRSLSLVQSGVQKLVATGFWDTMTTNSSTDPSAKGWRRIARAGACKFCTMVAGRGAVFTQSTVNFASHTNCHCVVAPSFDPNAPVASVKQYEAQSGQRTPKERADLRAYLNENYPGSPG